MCSCVWGADPGGGAQAGAKTSSLGLGAGREGVPGPWPPFHPEVRGRTYRIKVRTAGWLQCVRHYYSRREDPLFTASDRFEVARKICGGNAVPATRSRILAEATHRHQRWWRCHRYCGGRRGDQGSGTAAPSRSTWRRGPWLALPRRRRHPRPCPLGAIWWAPTGRLPRGAAEHSQDAPAGWTGRNHLISARLETVRAQLGTKADTPKARPRSRIAQAAGRDCAGGCTRAR